ncbi:unnamed protein product [Allacma fusca]|uniref:DUF2569 domain-containing protein n=1 Tax=Allacma fusca TaxID=39272 RepID=A0A8J2LNL5_9HEXA|nr:unnamed protein product [Allacma fusca]
MVYWTDFEFLCLIVAWVDITLYGLLVFVSTIFLILLLAIPEELDELIRMDPVEHEELEKFLSFSTTTQYAVGVSLLVFWVLMLTLSILLLTWARQRYVPGLKFWFGANLLVAIICTPLDFWMLVEKNFSFEAVATFVLATAYCVFALWVVGSLIRVIIKREGQIPHSVEFQSL